MATESFLPCNKESRCNSIPDTPILSILAYPITWAPAEPYTYLLFGSDNLIKPGSFIESIILCLEVMPLII